ncbi:MAG: SET domain-containing protein-lysine N-methyltransferase [Planctomycetota bacterium]|nr:SET domain-containing protein-lysine N-methyltransferase [Planctomycetota bacterium]
MSKTRGSDNDGAPPVRERAGGRRSQPKGRLPGPEDADGLTARGSSDKSVRIGQTRVGKGIFAQRRYPDEAVIGEIQGEVIDDLHYGSDYCMNIGENRVLEPEPPYRYVNHSCEPNCEFDFFDLTDPGASQSRRRVFLIALREIKPGEELTIDYNWSATSAIPCRCQAPSCRGWIVDPHELAALTARLAEGPQTEPVQCG